MKKFIEILKVVAAVIEVLIKVLPVKTANAIKSFIKK